MNGVRSIFRRKGYLLTALTAAVLLAASSGTAWAQSVGFDKTSGSVMETAFIESATPSSEHPPFELKVRVSGLPPVGDSGRPTSLLGLGEVMVTPSGATVVIYRVLPTKFGGPGGSTELAGADMNDAAGLNLFKDTDEVTLLVAPGGDAIALDDNWVDNDAVLTLSAGGAGIVSNPGQAVVTVIDEDVAPVVEFDRTSIVLGEESEATVEIGVESGSKRARIPRGLNSSLTGMEQPFSRPLKLTVSNADLVAVAVGEVGVCVVKSTDPKYGSIALSISAMRGAEDISDDLAFDKVRGTLTFGDVTVATLAGVPNADDDDARTAAGDPIVLRVEACGDKEFRDMEFEFAFSGSALRGGRTGNVDAGDPAMISIRSNDATPTVEFFPTDVFIDEGGEHDVLLSAAGDNGSDVMMATLHVEHDETNVGLYYKGGDRIEPNADGTLTVEIEDGQVRLTAKSYSDAALNDGDMAKVTWIIDSADGAEIGDGYWYTVNVRGSTAVPALPLVGQLLLALFLMAGGARLYRRRQG